MLVSEEQEIQLGRMAAPALKWSYGGEFSEPALKAYLQKIVKEIWTHAERPYLPLEFYIANTSVPNAFALPGYVSITRGLLAELQNEAQFAAIIGHEVGHVMARHTAKRITLSTVRQLGLLLGGVLLKDSPYADTIFNIGAISSALLLLQYDRQQELQADRLGVKYMVLVGYRPEEAINAHHQLQKAIRQYRKRMELKHNESFLDAILSTHPRHERRVSELQLLINNLPPYRLRGDGIFKERFLKYTERLRKINRIYFIYDRAVLYYNRNRIKEAEINLLRAIKMASDQAPFYNLYGMILLKQQKHTEAEEMFKKALQQDKGYQPALYALGLVYLQRGNPQKAIEHFNRSLSLYPEHPGSLLGKGKALLKLNECRRALTYLRRFSSYQYQHPEVHGLMAICYERTGNLKEAIRSCRVQIEIAPENDLGRYCRRRLLLLRPWIR